MIKYILCFVFIFYYNLCAIDSLFDQDHFNIGDDFLVVTDNRLGMYVDEPIFSFDNSEDTLVYGFVGHNFVELGDYYICCSDGVSCPDTVCEDNYIGAKNFQAVEIDWNVSNKQKITLGACSDSDYSECNLKFLPPTSNLYETESTSGFLTKMILMIDYNTSAYANTVTGNLNILIDSKSRVWTRESEDIQNFLSWDDAWIDMITIFYIYGKLNSEDLVSKNNYFIFPTKGFKTDE